MSGTEYEKTRENTVQRKKDRAKYDKSVVHSIVHDAHGVCHLAFVDEEGMPQCIPMMGVVDDRSELGEEVWMYFHGYTSTRIMKALADPGTPMVATCTLVDGLVFALNVSHHAVNYRSAVFHGVSYPLPAGDREAKEHALTCVMESVMPGRWAEARAMNNTDWADVGVIRMKVESASAKIRKGMPGNEKADAANEELTARVWSGILPFRVVSDPPVPLPFCADRPVPENIKMLERK
ncbi:hypothetical protein DACRYDRAFT_20166 [Dacryopinax primogenitus]|uniref:Flavin-nucleotide-binding protein n=1 Tax=Dacryopinax primogenitus (strain DJM 731) TaxID=1858805 RepID=M5GAD1_DACPD|nr:uncharacterized protein DACRYDRAFT_20166 [Dacryopinax primogenitus]EJU05784.1 hypothetical protein DACRYDRAFT_20166 [Dacryopinax primogenitus]